MAMATLKVALQSYIDLNHLQGTALQFRFASELEDVAFKIVHRFNPYRIRVGNR
ncbi:MAG: hypothetical protein HW380_1074 [Magnetococcales bacterium]|nr:hypothetical protein [Magnetococcales bacterium]